MNAVLTLKPVTDKKGNTWHAGQIIGLNDLQAKAFVGAKNGLDMAKTNFALAAMPDNKAAAVTAPSSADFSLAMLGVNSTFVAKAPKPAPAPAPAPEPTPVTPEVTPVEPTPVETIPAEETPTV